MGKPFWENEGVTNARASEESVIADMLEVLSETQELGIGAFEEGAFSDRDGAIWDGDLFDASAICEGIVSDDR